MIAEFKSHKIAYIVLSTVLFICVLLFLHFWPDRSKQRIVAVLMSLFYFFWGIIVHKNSKHINSKVIFEYLAVSLLSGTILILLTF
ncbi:MAG: hypothetical protein COZ34_02465 [Candidatus Pacebacteria bacterium CG_4_10_14_3_um_filter_34_15]|nr:hypothetical protein [Candidatus Paceibacterota bacterium]OIO44906.1 MAG: hypothetical protein AUJ41_01465 [Candidatus Pacebacteria bacterium CG1_02_43_31]PIQ80535.1 MAG: hypothetical protein COV78_05060 [Candidatus Pacebacteria bacterium CG11_big_fil_rev_8_21_14_0_20_34_55]PIX81581.1 MAG: hypothetical protein COZ34_02465 [Candidatus Pacebacteria bacterium CG_4_10_14_3_um_filter_34_15]PJC44170.1 MAG: hypothetical protein CO039_00210 [Candidatus Pacebacteria bacterium CG_4_9_14_0_2_um_filter_